MKPVWKLSGTLLLNQFLADIACGMCVIPLPFIFGNGLFTYVLFLGIMVFFFYYISYNGAYKSGFHDVARHSSAEYDRGFIKRGLLASAIAAAPTVIMFILWYIGRAFGINILYSVQVPLFFWTLFASWPLQLIIPNHMAACFLITIAMQFIFPLIGYFCGYKGIVFKDKFLKLLGLNKNS